MFFKKKPKIAKKDFSPVNLPKNRTEVFKDVFKHHWFSFLSLGGLSLLFALPYVGLKVYEGLLSSSIAARYVAGEITALDASNSLVAIANSVSAINIVLIVLYGVFVAGMLRILKRYAFMENVTFNQDFALGIKQNWKQMILIFFIFGLFAFLTDYVETLSSLVSNSLPVFSWVGIIPQILAVVLMYPVFAYAICAISIYTNKFSQQTRTGLILYLHSPFKTLGALVLASLPLVPMLFSNIYVNLIGGLIGFLVLPLFIFGWFLFTLNKLDKFYNPDKYPSLVGRGLLGLEYAKSQKEEESAEKEEKTIKEEPVQDHEKPAPVKEPDEVKDKKNKDES